MSLLVYPSFETAALNTQADFVNSIYDRANLFVSDPSRTSAFSQFRTGFPSRPPTCCWRDDYQKIANEFSTLTSDNHEAFDFEKISAHHKLWTPQKIPNSNLDFSLNLYKNSSKTKNTELWRPFSPPPLDDPQASDNYCTAGTKRYCERFPVIAPSSVKIEPSNSSVFKPVKKKKYACPYCTLVYTNGAQLKTHFRKHKGAKPYKCEFPNCLKSFSRNEELTRHRRIHSGYKPYHCNVCGKSFCRKDHLSKHLKTHLQISEKKIYVCCVPGCEHRYTRSDALTRHKSTAHSIRKTSTATNNKTKQQK